MNDKTYTQSELDAAVAEERRSVLSDVRLALAMYAKEDGASAAKDIAEIIEAELRGIR